MFLLSQFYFFIPASLVFLNYAFNGNMLDTHILSDEFLFLKDFTDPNCNSIRSCRFSNCNCVDLSQRELFKICEFGLKREWEERKLLHCDLVLQELEVRKTENDRAYLEISNDIMLLKQEETHITTLRLQHDQIRLQLQNSRAALRTLQRDFVNLQQLAENNNNNFNAPNWNPGVLIEGWPAIHEEFIADYNRRASAYRTAVRDRQQMWRTLNAELVQQYWARTCNRRDSAIIDREIELANTLSLELQNEWNENLHYYSELLREQLHIELGLASSDATSQVSLSNLEEFFVSSEELEQINRRIDIDPGVEVLLRMNCAVPIALLHVLTTL